MVAHSGDGDCARREVVGHARLWRESRSGASCFFFGGGAFWGLFRGPLKFGGYFGALKTSRGLLGGSSTLSGGRGRLGRF